MNKLNTKIKDRYIGLLLSAMVLITITSIQLISCGVKKTDPVPTLSPQDEVRAKLTANSWSVQGVSVDGVDQTNVYKGLTIKFDASNFTTANGGVVWPASGTWSFTNNDGTIIKRNDGIEIKVEATDATLKLTLTWTKTTLGGRHNSVKGLNVFSFAK